MAPPPGPCAETAPGAPAPSLALLPLPDFSSLTRVDHVQFPHVLLRTNGPLLDVILGLSGFLTSWRRHSLPPSRASVVSPADLATEECLRASRAAGHLAGGGTCPLHSVLVGAETRPCVRTAPSTRLVLFCLVFFGFTFCCVQLLDLLWGMNSVW